jgi:hypothetical protein
LLIHNYEERLGHNDINEIMSHEFFKGKYFLLDTLDINWLALKRAPGLIVPRTVIQENYEAQKK